MGMPSQLDEVESPEPSWLPGCPSAIGGRYSAVALRTTACAPNPRSRKKVVGTFTDTVTWSWLVVPDGAVTTTHGAGALVMLATVVVVGQALSNPLRATSTRAALEAAAKSPGRYATPASAPAAAARST